MIGSVPVTDGVHTKSIENVCQTMLWSCWYAHLRSMPSRHSNSAAFSDELRNWIDWTKSIVELLDIIAKMHTDYKAAPNRRIVQQPLEVTIERAIWIMLSTLCRVGEMSLARWEHARLVTGVWLIQKENVKESVADLTAYPSAFALDQFVQLHARTGHTAW